MVNKIFKSLISYLLLASIFVTGGGSAGMGFVTYWYFPLYILFICYGIAVYQKLNIRVIVFFVSLIVYSLLTNVFGFNLVVKQIFNLALYGLVFYYFLWHERFDLPEIFRKYVNVSKVILVIGFIQVILFLTGLGHLYSRAFPFLLESHTDYRLQSITQEPALVAFTFAPVVFLSLQNIFYGTRYLINRKWSFLFVIGYLLTLSSVAYAGFLLMLVVLYFKNFSIRKVQLAVFAFMGIMLTAYIAYQTIPFIKLRVDDTVFGIQNDFVEGDNYLQVNLSTFALLSNYYVTTQSLKDRPLTGHGLGTHAEVYERYLPAKMKSFRFYALNSEDANSLGLRLLTETGLIGFFIFCLFTASFKIKSRMSFDQTQDLLWVLNTGIFVLIMLALLRNGNYTMHGKLLFFLLYYYSYKIAKKVSQPAGVSNPVPA